MTFRQTVRWPLLATALSLLLAWSCTPSWTPLSPVYAQEAEATDGFENDAGHGDGEGHAADAHDDAHAAHANTNPLSFDPDLTIFTGIVFLLLLTVLTKFAWIPIRDAVEAREKRIEEQLAEARRSAEESKRLLREHEARLAAASEEVRSMIDGAKRDADQQKSQILAEAQMAAQAEKDRAVREIDAAKNDALEQLATRSVDTALGLAGQIVGRQLNKEDHASLIQDALHRLPSDN